MNLNQLLDVIVEKRRGPDFVEIKPLQFPFRKKSGPAIGTITLIYLPFEFLIF